jgi:Ni/Co efflux regulator RcnB
MKKIINSFVIAASIAAISVTSVSTAQAHDIYVQHHHHKHVQRNNNSDDAIVWGILGLAAGAIIAGSVNNQQSHRRVVTPQRHYPGANHYPPAPRHSYRQKRRYQHSRHTGGYEPWTKGWYNYCDNRYRSFNPRTGTFRGYDGRDHFCVAR